MPEQDNPERYMSVQTTFMKGFETDYVGTRMAGKEDVSARYYLQSPMTLLKTDPGMCVCACLLVGVLACVCMSVPFPHLLDLN